MAYTVIARRYRSQTFDDVVGQDAVAKTLKNAIQMGRVAHAYLFCGTRGVGKTTMARILAKSLNCLKADGPTVKPCLECDSCKAINTGEDIDVLEIDGASNTGVDNIRQLRENAMYRPARSRFKIYIIDEVHMLSAGAFNALLKILEEPPEHVKFIFATTEPHKVLPTIQSRCQRFDFQNISTAVIGQQLEKILKDEKIGSEKDLIIHLSRLANGSMRDALSLLDQLISGGQTPLTLEQLTAMLGIPDRQQVIKLLTAIGEQDGAGTLGAVDELLHAGQNPVGICDLAVENMRDLMVFMTAGADSPALSLTDDEKKQLAQLAEKFDVPALIYNITALEKLRWNLKNSETSRPLLEAALLRLALSEHFIGLEQLRGDGGKGSAQGAVKKKSLNVSTPVQSTAAQEAAPAQGGVSIGADLQSIQEQWESIAANCAQEDSSLAVCLKQGTPAALNGSTLEIRFAKEFDKAICERKADKIARMIAPLIGMDIQVKLGLGGSQTKTAAAAAEAPQPAKANRRQQNEALNDPVVQMVLKGLDATPVEIERVGDEEQEGQAKDTLFEEEN
ncbi:MAG: DNA polymerase III subunit gamma/tau [Planctomycetaceae bacterium]|nr:DNA polymerase III subunit gamma/tau [Planctomycetaceae bacterium]